MAKAWLRKKNITDGVGLAHTPIQNDCAAAAALTMAMEAIDTDPLFHPKAEARAERFWRLGAQSVRAPVPET
jgi:hypothetical protein